MSLQDNFTVYLSSRNSIDIYPFNRVSSFTNKIVPPIELNSSPDNYEVSLNSCILPFLGYSKILENENFKAIWHIVKQVDDSNGNKKIITQTEHITFTVKQIINLPPTQIYKKFVESSKSTTELKYVEQMLEIYNNHLALTSRYVSKIITRGIWANILKISLILNKNMQILFGFDDAHYVLFEADSQYENMPMSRTIFANKEINLNIQEPNFILVYCDIVEPSRFGNQYLNILDILPLGKSISLDRKHSKLSWKTLNKSIINEISIIIQDPNFDILTNYSENIIVSLNFRKKS